ncbi:MAG: hypothetical protein PVI28_19655 [Gammaproteobacteria bacterium]
MLNKVYLAIVREQGFTEGRNAKVSAVGNVHRNVEPGTETGVKQAALGY